MVCNIIGFSCLRGSSALRVTSPPSTVNAYVTAEAHASRKLYALILRSHNSFLDRLEETQPGVVTSDRLANRVRTLMAPDCPWV